MRIYQGIIAILLTGHAGAAPKGNPSPPSVTTKTITYTSHQVSTVPTTLIQQTTKTISGQLTTVLHTTTTKLPITVTVTKIKTTVSTKSRTKTETTKITKTDKVTSKQTKTTTARTTKTETVRSIKTIVSTLPGPVTTLLSTIYSSLPPSTVSVLSTITISTEGTTTFSTILTTTALTTKTVKSIQTIVTTLPGSVTTVFSTLTPTTTTTSSTTSAAPTAPLPPNLVSQFGGKDITAAQNDGFKTGLFDFTKGGPGSMVTISDGPVTNPKGGTSGTSTTYMVPSFMNLDNVGGYFTNTIAGEDRQDYQSKLSNSLSSGASIFGFGAEFSTSFSESSKVETYQKYAGSYTLAKLYTINLNSPNNAQELRQYMTVDALKLFANGTAADIVARYGTHFMTSATFGGFKRYTSVVNIRDTSVSNSLQTAFSIRVAVEDPEIGDPSANGSISNQDEETQKFYKLTSNAHSQCFGGTVACQTSTGADATKDWYESIPQNPVISTQKLLSLDHLMLPTDLASGADVLAVINTILAAQQLATAKALVIYKPMVSDGSDHGSGANDDLVLNNVQADPGWFTLGQYAQGSGTGGPDGAFLNNPGSYMGIQIQETDSVAPGSILRQPTGMSASRIWGMSDNGGFTTWEITNIPTGFASLGSVFKQTDDDQNVSVFGSMVVVNTSILIPAGYTGPRIWQDHGSGANDDGSIRGVTGPDDTTSSGGLGVMQKNPNTNANPSYLFHCSSEEDGIPHFPAYQLDFSQIKVVDDRFLSDVSL